MILESWRDVVGGLSLKDYWLTMAWNDIRTRYRRSKIGQFWITLSVALFVVGVGTVYSGIFGTPVEQYMPRVAISYVMWVFISAILTGGCTTFISAASTMQQRVFPISAHALRLVARESFILAHNALVIIAVFLIFRIGIYPSSSLAVLGVLGNIYIAFWTSLVLGIISARYRDVPPIMVSLVNILFFITPVLWTTGKLGGTSDLVLQFNPLAYLVEVVRDPLLGIAPPLSTWLILLAIAGIVTAAGMLLMSVTRDRLNYWL